MKSVTQVFQEVKAHYKLKNKKVFLASGGLVDVKGPGTSDVDIVYLTKTKNT